MRSFQQKLSEFAAFGVAVVGISVDSVDINRAHHKKIALTFPLLSDPSAATIRRYDLLHPGAGPNHSDIARPAEFLVDSGGTVRWRNLTENIAVRLRPEQALQAFKALSHD